GGGGSGGGDPRRGTGAPVFAVRGRCPRALDDGGKWLIPFGLRRFSSPLPSDLYTRFYTRYTFTSGRGVLTTPPASEHSDNHLKEPSPCPTNILPRPPILASPRSPPSPTPTARSSPTPPASGRRRSAANSTTSAPGTIQTAPSRNTSDRRTPCMPAANHGRRPRGPRSRT